MELLVALLIGSCGTLSQITCNASLSSVIDLGLGGACDKLPISHPIEGSPYSIGPANLEAIDRF